MRAWIRRRGSPGWYSRTPAKRAGFSNQPAAGPLDAAPAWRLSETMDRHGPRPDEVSLATLAPRPCRRRPANRSPTRSVDGSQAETPLTVGDDREAPRHPLERRERPGVAERLPAAVGRLELALADDDAGRGLVVGPQPGERQSLPVPGADGERDLVADDGPVASEAPLVDDVAQPASSPDRSNELDQQAGEAEQDDDRRAQQAADQHEGEPEAMPGRSWVSRRRPAGRAPRRGWPRRHLRRSRRGGPGRGRP